MSKVSLIALTLMFAFVLVANTGCMRCNPAKALTERAVEQAIERSTGGKAKIDVGDNVDISGLPAQLRYPGAVAKSRWSMSTDKGSGAAYTFETADPTATVVAHFKQAMAGWKEAMSAENEGVTILGYGTSDEKQWTTISVSKKDEGVGTVITIVYGTK